MAVFITSTAQARRHGVYAIERTPPATVRATGTGTGVLVAQFAWGPSQKLTYPSDTASLINMVAPPGMDRRTKGYLSVIRKGFPRLGFIRVLGATAVAATCILLGTGPATALTLTAKYPGTAGNSIIAVVSTATDGNATHYNLSVSITGPTGTTVDFLQNLSTVNIGTATQIANAYLIGATTSPGTGLVPLPGTYTFSGGTDGTITATDYVGTPGTANKGVALCETDQSVDAVFTGDPGNTIRPAVNAGFQGHADLMTDRVAYLNGDSGMTAAQVLTDVANYRSLRVCYADVWPYIYDDTDGTKTLVPPAPFAASVASQLSPSTSIAWKSPECQALLSGIIDLEADRGDGAATNSDQGITTLIRERDGGFTFEAAKNTYNAVDPSRGSLKRTRMGHYLGRSVTGSFRPYVDSPNVPSNQQDEIDAVTDFLATLLNNARIDANHLPHIVGYTIQDIRAFNPQVSIDQGNFVVPADVKISSDQERIFFSVNYGETVKAVVTL